MYHYVRPTDPALPYFRHLDLVDFKKQLSYLEEQYGFLSKSDFLHSLETCTPKPGIVLTFDDGFRDHYKYVLPCLLERGLWGIFYIPTSFYQKGKLLDVHQIHLLIGMHGGEVVFNALKSLVSENMLSHGNVEEFRKLTYRDQKNDDYTNLVKRTLNYYISYDHREFVIYELMRRLLHEDGSLVNNFYMSPMEIRQLQEKGMIVGSHTVNHPVMSKLSKDDQEKEIIQSFNFLEDITGGLSLKTFCYPYGGFYSFTKETEMLLEERGCLFSFNVEPKNIDEYDLRNRRQALPRYDCNQFPFGASQE